MHALPPAVLELVAVLNQLPGVGPRTAERLALHIVQSPVQGTQDLARAITTARERVAHCHVCGALTESQPCRICSDPLRDGSIVCVVERPVDVLLIEKAGTYRGRFHVLGGKLSPIDGIGPEDLRIADLESRIDREPIREVVLALPTDVEGDATSHYIAKQLASKGVKITRLARGLPAGSGLEFADELTLARALEDRHPMLPPP
ncbi:MAG: recombination mediator RecR [Verrucomicrobiae bacterium]|nr:recombination mediator RecR [Verrucomicrobiae bacterium]